MCAGSLALGIERQTQIGDDVVVTPFRSGRRTHMLFAPPDNPTCVSCLPYGATVVFNNLTPDIQQFLGVGAQARAIMQEYDNGYVRDDVFVFDNGQKIKLSRLPAGTSLKHVAADYVFLDETDRKGNAVMNEVAARRVPVGVTAQRNIRTVVTGAGVAMLLLLVAFIAI